MKSENNVEEAIKKKLSFTASTELHDRMLNDVLNAQEQSKKTKSAATGPRIGRIIMKSSITKLAAAAVIVIAIVLATSFMNKSMSTVSAQEVLAQATKAVANLRSVYIKAEIRTIAHDNFEMIRLDYDFVTNEMWKEFDGTPQGKWRVEKSGRVVVMDGESSLLLIRPNHAAKGGITTGFVGWLKPLLDVNKVLDSEIKLAQEQGSELLLTHQQGLDGKDKLLVSVEALAQGDFTNDWLRNKSISASDNLRIYTFDAETKLLETLEVYVHTAGEDVLVLQITDIEYNPYIDPALFALEIPEDVIWYGEPKEVANNEKYEQMGPKEMAEAFFQACADENWDEFLKFWSASAVDQRIKDYLGGIEIISIGEPFKSGRYAGWFVPYEIKFKNGQTKKMNLAVRNDNPANRYVVDGGI
jgi:outer membrane lipoprotein-sorting protein